MLGVRFGFAQTLYIRFSFARTHCLRFSFAETRFARFQTASEVGSQPAVRVVFVETAVPPFPYQAAGFFIGCVRRLPVAVHQVVEGLQKAVARHQQAAARGMPQPVRGQNQADEGVAAVAAGEGGLFEQHLPFDGYAPQYVRPPRPRADGVPDGGGQQCAAHEVGQVVFVYQEGGCNDGCRPRCNQGEACRRMPPCGEGCGASEGGMQRGQVVVRHTQMIRQCEPRLPKAFGKTRRIGRLNGQEDEKRAGGGQFGGQNGKQRPSFAPVSPTDGSRQQQRHGKVNRTPGGQEGDGGLKRQGGADAPRNIRGNQIAAAVARKEQQGEQGGQRKEETVRMRQAGVHSIRPCLNTGKSSGRRGPRQQLSQTVKKCGPSPAWRGSSRQESSGCRWCAKCRW